MILEAAQAFCGAEEQVRFPVTSFRGELLRSVGQRHLSFAATDSARAEVYRQLPQQSGEIRKMLLEVSEPGRESVIISLGITLMEKSC